MVAVAPLVASPAKIPETAPAEVLSMILYSVPTTGPPSSDALSVAPPSDSVPPATSWS